MKRILAALLLLGLLGFGVFGLLATFEPDAPGTSHLPWKIGYAMLSLGCLAGLVRLQWRR